jgi:hypothetical protein
MIADALANTAEILKERHCRHSHGQSAYVGRTDAYNSLRHGCARPMATVGRGIRHAQDPSSQRGIRLDQFARLVQVEVLM